MFELQGRAHANQTTWPCWRLSLSEKNGWPCAGETGMPMGAVPAPFLTLSTVRSPEIALSPAAWQADREIVPLLWLSPATFLDASLSCIPETLHLELTCQASPVLVPPPPLVKATPLSLVPCAHWEAYPLCDIPSGCCSFTGPGRSPVLPFACCVGSLLSVGRCGQCSCWCRFRVCGAQ